MRKPKLKIFIDTEVLVHPHFSGIGHYTLELLRALDRLIANDPTVKVVLATHWRQRGRLAAYGFKNFKIVPSPFSQRISNGLKIRGWQPPLDLIFGKHVYIFPNYTSWPLLFSKSISFIYDLSFEKYPEYAEPRNQVFLSNQVKKSAQRSRIIATISNNSRQEICDFYHIDPANVKVLYPAVNQSEYYRRSNNEVSAVKTKYHIDGKYILFVGNIEPRKNLKNLLLAYEQLSKKDRQEYALVLVGAKGWRDGEIFTIIKRLQKEGNRIIQPRKYVEDADLPAIYSGASLFVYPSIYEGFGIPPIEAMACGVPVITSDNSSLPEAVGQAAVMVNAHAVDDIAASITKVLRSTTQQRSMIDLGYRQADSFSWDVAARKLLDNIREIA